jgi:transposase-like protein
VTAGLQEQVRAWHHRELKDGYQYLILDGMRVSLQIERGFSSKPNGLFHGSRTRFFMKANG